MKRFLLAFAVIFGMSATIAGTVILVHQHREVTMMRQFAAAGPATLMREEALDRRAGMTLGPEEMQRPLPPPSQNAAPLYVKLTKMLHDKPLGLPKYAEGMDAFHSYTPAQIAAVRRTLAARQDVMILVHQAADRPQCVFVRDWKLGADVQFPEYQPMREAVRLLKTESYLLARNGRYEEAATNQARGFRIAEHSGSDPVLLAYLVGVACDLVTLSGMQSILAIAGPNHALDTEVHNIITAKQPKLSLHSALAGEAGFGCACLLKMHQAESQGITAALTAGGLPRDPDDRKDAVDVKPQNIHSLIDAWQADYLAHMRVLVTACDLPSSKRRAAFSAADRHLSRETQDTSNPTHLVTLLLMPTFATVDENELRVHTRVAVTLAAAAVLTAEAKTGAYPDSLPPGFTDPFTNKPLGYRREGANGFVVYSVGSSGTYAGSKPGDKVPPSESEFRYPPVPLPITTNMLK